jgi:hypothetical protein
LYVGLPSKSENIAKKGLEFGWSPVCDACEECEETEALREPAGEDSSSALETPRLTTNCS